jgi:hypothetical protein
MSGGGWVKLGVVTLLGLALAGVVLQRCAGWPAVEVVPLSVGDGAGRDGHGVRVSIPKRYRGAVTDLRGEVYYAGVPLGPRAATNRDVREHGCGRYRIADRVVWLSMPDNSDPRDAPGEFLLRAPRPVRVEWPVGLCIGFLLALGWASREGSLREAGAAVVARLDAVSPLVIPLGAALVAGAIGVSDAWRDEVRVYDVAFSVNGMPYSDAMGWHELALRLASGQGLDGPFAAQRPFFPMALGAVYLVVEPSVRAALVFNAAVWAGTAFFVSSLGLVARSRAVALVLGVAVAFSPGHRQMSGLLLTEELGVCLAAASLVAFCCALVGPGAGERRTALLLLASGMLFGFSNLARPLTLLAAPFLAVVVVHAGLSAGGERRWRRVVLDVVALAAGVALVIGPWIVRQKLVFGITTISSTSADLLYAGALGVEWGGALFEELEAAGTDGSVREQVEFFMRRYRETVAADPAGYARRVAADFAGFFQGFGTGDQRALPLALFVCLAASVGVALWQRSVAGVLVFAALWPLAVVASAVPPPLVFLCSVAAVAWLGDRVRRLVLAAAIATLAGNALLSAMIGNFGLVRMAGLRDALMLMVVTLGVLELVRLVAGVLARWLEGWRRESAAVPVPRGVVAAAVAVLGLCLAATAALGMRHLVGGPPAQPHELSPGERKAVAGWVLPHLPSLAGGGEIELREDFVVELVDGRLYHTHLGANEDVGHWSNAFAPRPYPRTVSFARVGGDWRSRTGQLVVEFPERLDLPAGLSVLVGIRNVNPDAALGHERVLVEALALVPWSPDGGPDLAAGRVFRPSPEAAAVLAGSQAPAG